MIVTFLIIVLGLFWCLVFEIPIYAVVSVAAVVIIALVALALVIDKWQIEDAERVARAILTEEIAVYKEKVQNTGFSLGWNGSGRSYYRYKKVFDHYECVFSVVYKDGRTGTIKCRKDSNVYNILIWKTKN